VGLVGLGLRPGLGSEEEMEQLKRWVWWV